MKEDAGQATKLTGKNEEGSRDDWCTSEAELKRVRLVFGGRIDLDPCNNAQSTTDPLYEFRLPETDGLLTPWGGPWKVFVNPPYGAGVTRRWLEKVAEEAKTGSDIITLTAARAGAKWFQELVLGTANATCLYDHRLKFVGAEDVAMFDVAMSYWGTRFKQKFLDEFHAQGACFDLDLWRQWNDEQRGKRGNLY